MFKKIKWWPQHPSKAKVERLDNPYAAIFSERQEQFERDWQREYPNDPLRSDNFEVNAAGLYEREMTRIAFRMWRAGQRRGKQE